MKSLVAGLALVAISISVFAEVEPGDVCRKEGEMVWVYGDGLTCAGGKYVVTMIGPLHTAGAPCWSVKGKELKPDKFGMVCKEGRFQRADNPAKSK